MTLRSLRAFLPQPGTRMQAAREPMQGWCTVRPARSLHLLFLFRRRGVRVLDRGVVVRTLCVARIQTLVWNINSVGPRAWEMFLGLKEKKGHRVYGAPLCSDEGEREGGRRGVCTVGSGTLAWDLSLSLCPRSLPVPDQGFCVVATAVTATDPLSNFSRGRIYCFLFRFVRPSFFCGVVFPERGDLFSAHLVVRNRMSHTGCTGCKFRS